ncbi:MAG: (S)-ureidoglycine aminohydrolase [Chloroflexi bacterium]|nr:(S)-ureidoglycine aminohydrolase [Chloroflexota bacterium]
MRQTNLLVSRAIVQKDFAILPPEGLVDSALPIFKETVTKIMAAPAMGAGFAEYLIEMRPNGGTAQPLQEELEVFLFVLEGTGELLKEAQSYGLSPGDYAYLPPGTTFQISHTSGECFRFLLLKKPYQPAGIARPHFLLKNEREVPRDVYQNLEGAHLQTLLPTDPAFDMAMNIFTFQPGWSLPIIETHIMEHGLYILEGKGLYFLGKHWYEVQAGDFIWMAPFTPQSFYCTGAIPARYIYYKDVNRDVQFKH